MANIINEDDLIFLQGGGNLGNKYMNEENSLPTLKKVIAAAGNKVAIGDDLASALTNLVSQYAVDIEVENTDNIEDLIDAIIRANENLKQSNESNDWTMIGKDMDKLQSLIEQLDVLVQEQKKESEENQENTLTNEISNDINEQSISNTVQNYISNE